MGYQRVFQRKEILPFAATQTNVEVVTLREVRPRRGNTTQHRLDGKAEIVRDESRNVVPRVRGDGDWVMV